MINLQKYGLISIIILTFLMGCPRHSSVNKPNEKISHNDPSSGKLETGRTSKPEIQSLPESKTEEEIKNIAQQSTVLISTDGEVSGAGVIIGKDTDSQTLYILTAKHVVYKKPGLIEDENGQEQPTGTYEIRNYKGELLTEIVENNYDESVEFIDDDTDLAVLKISPKPNNTNLKPVELAGPIQNNSAAYIFGYLPCNYQPGQSPKTQFSTGSILEQNEPKYDPSVQLKGYDIKYDNNTIAGMSGSGVFDAAGRLIAIHTRAEKTKDYNSETCDQLGTEPNDTFGGDNEGTSIKKNFAASATNLVPNITISSSSINVKGSSPKTQKTPPSPTQKDTFKDGSSPAEKPSDQDCVGSFQSHKCAPEKNR